MLKEVVRLSSLALILAASMLLATGKVNAADFIVQNDISQSRRLEKYVHSKGSLDDTVDEYEIKVPNGKYAIVSVSGERSVGDVECASGLYVGSLQYINSDIELRCNAGTSYITVRLSVSIFDYQTHACQWQYWIEIKYYDLVPDLTVSSVSTDPPDDVAVDETVTLTYSVRNVGQLNATVSTVARIYDGTEQVCGDQTIPPVAAGGVVTQSVTLPMLSEGEHMLKVVADATGMINEANENNNFETVELRGYRRVPVDVIFDSNGVGTQGKRRVVAGNVVGDPLPIVTRRGYEFVGWWTDSTGGYEISGSEKITRARTFYARWSAVQSEIALNRQGGGNGDSSSVATFGQALPRVAVPARVGHAFAGYWTEIGGRGTQYYDSDGKGVRTWDCALSEVTLYAKWIPKDESVVFDQQGGSGGSGSVTATFEAQLPEIVPPARSGWVFQGYYSSPNGEGLKYYDGSGKGVRIWDQLNEDPQSLYAFWLPVQMNYTIEFDLQGGVGDFPETTATYASPLPSVVPPKREQYAFEGYYSEPNGGGVQYYDAAGESTAKWDLPRNASLYAKWVKAHHVVLDPNGAEGSFVTQYFTDETWRLRKCPFSRTDGLVFAGWALEPDGVPVLADESVVGKALLNLEGDPDADSATLYAQWGTVCSCSQYPDIQFITGEPAWIVDADGLRSPGEGGRSWLTAVLDNRGTVDFSFTNTSPRVVSASVAYAGGERFYDVGCKTDEKNVVDIATGKRLLTWICTKDLPILHDWNGQSPTGDLIVLESLLAERKTRQSKSKTELCDIISRLVYAVDGRAYRRFQIENHVQQAVQEAVDDFYFRRMNSGSVLDYVISVIIGFNEDVTLVRQAINNGSDDGNNMKAIGKGLVEIIDDIRVLEEHINGFCKIKNLSHNKFQLVGFLLDDDSEYEAAKGMINELSDKREAFDDVIEQICEEIIPLLKECYYSWSSSQQAKAEWIIRDVFNRSDYWGWMNYVSSCLAQEFDITMLKQTESVGYCDIGYRYIYWSEIKSLFQLATEMHKSMLLLQQQISGSGVLSYRLVENGSVIGDLPMSERTGYDFDGWWTAPNGGRRVDEKMVVTDDMALYARYELKTFEILFDANGGEGGSRRTVRYGDTLGAADGLPVPTRAGYAFAGWLDAKSGEVASVLSLPLDDCVYVAQWTKNTDWAADAAPEYEWHDEGAGNDDPLVDPVITNTITYVGLEGAVNPNPLTFTTDDLPIVLLPVVRGGWKFAGWTPNGGVIPVGTSTNLTVSANWEKVVPQILPEEDDPMDAGIANTYDGVITDLDGLPVGYINVKAAKANKNTGVCKVTVAIQMVGEAKKVSVKGEVKVDEAEFTKAAPDGRVLELAFTRNGIYGLFDGYEIGGARNLLSSKGSTDEKKSAEAAFKRWMGNYVLAFGDDNGWNGLSLSVMAKGKVKVSGALADGTKVTTSTQMIVGEDYCCVPVIYTKKAVSLAFSVYFPNDGGEPTVFGYYDAVISSVGGLADKCAFRLDGELYDLFDEAGYELVEDFLPWDVPVVQNGKKWVVADGAKAGMIKMSKDGDVYDSKESENPSGLKLTFTSKTGIFKGSFKVYALTAAGKLKSFSATVNGVVVDGCGYGTATIKKFGSIPIVIE